MNGMDFDLLGQARKPSRAFAISWKKLANHRVHLRSPERSSQTIAHICDLLGEARKPSRTFAISWEKLANHRAHLRSPGRSSQTIARIFDLLGEARKPSRAISSIQRHGLKFVTVASARDPHKFPQQLLRVGGRRPHLSCSDGLTFFAVKILHRLSNPSRSPFGSPPFDGFLLTWGSQTPMRNRLRSVWTRLDFDGTTKAVSENSFCGIPEPALLLRKTLSILCLA